MLICITGEIYINPDTIHTIVPDNNIENTWQIIFKNGDILDEVTVEDAIILINACNGHLPPEEVNLDTIRGDNEY